jgi:hypothetical protein
VCSRCSIDSKCSPFSSSSAAEQYVLGNDISVVSSFSGLKNIGLLILTSVCEQCATIYQNAELKESDILMTKWKLN